MTRLLHELRDGSRTALDQIFPQVYAELRAIAQRELGREHQRRTIEATALVHEAYCKLVDQAKVDWQDRNHFFAVAARAMRQALVDAARERLAQKRGGDWERVTFSGVGPGFEIPLRELVALDRALDRLEQMEPRLRQVVELRYFAGLTAEETASVLEVTERTVQRDWIKARAWLYKEIYPEPAP
ncbi:MAG: sigma-70 family RNA polymerase sigma factor [Candidatus Eisenbacteria bacterium]|uniref:Sigma-70 family RNA polymerase sigma factor n=1 Tax=Eiseniibacteriota bacterium TaxID=2212470 RepID=A0A956RPL4_UNCEI|nr:sigma-70 family RNA polymerase sigma factor [Candidatus Eisenbacteria bacterium]